MELAHGVQVGVPALNKCYARVRTRIVYVDVDDLLVTDGFRCVPLRCNESMYEVCVCVDKGNLCHLHNIVAYAMIVCDRCASDRERQIRRCICKSWQIAMYGFFSTLDVICMTRHSITIDTCCVMAPVLVWLGMVSVYVWCQTHSI